MALNPITFEQALKIGGKTYAETKKLRDVNARKEQFKEPPTRLGMFNRLIDVLQRGNYASANLVMDAINKGEFRPLQSVWDGLAGKKKVLYSDVLEEAGMENKWARSGLGLALDIVADPVTWLSLGTGSAAKIGGKALSKVGTQSLKQLTKSWGRRNAEIIMHKLIKEEGGEKLLAKGGIKFAGRQFIKPEWIDKMGEVTRAKPAAQALVKTAPLQWFGRSFIPKFRPADVSKTAYKKMMKGVRLWDEAERAGATQAIETAQWLNAKFSKKQRESIADAIEDSKGNLARLRALLPEELHAPAEIVSEGYGKIAKEEYKRGLIKTIREGYVPHLYIGIKKGNYGRIRTYPTFAEAQKAGYEPIKDIAQLYAVRGVDSARRVAYTDFYRKMANTFGKPIEYIETKKGKRMAQWTSGWGSSKTSALSGYEFPKEIVREIDEFSRYFTDKATKDFLHGYDVALGFWKTSVTSLFPAFHSRNWLSNQWQMFIGGMNPLKFKARTQTAYELQRLAYATKMKEKTVNLYGKAIPIEEVAARTLESGYRYDEVIKISKDTGTMNRGWYGLELMLQGSDAAVREIGGHKGLRKLLPQNLMGTGRQVGTNVENNSRLAFLVDRLEKGDSIDDASKAVKKFLFDYGELTPFEKKWMRRVFPFYTWMRKNIPLQFEMLARTPGRYAGLGKVRDEINAISKEEAASEKYMPEWQRKMYGIRVPFGKTTEGYHQYVYPDMAFMDLARGTDLERWVASVSPVIKAPFEFAANRDFFRRKNLVNPDLPPNIQNWEKAKAIVVNNLRVAGTLRRMSRDDRVLLDHILDEIIGINVYPYNPKLGARYMRFEKQRERAALRKRAKQKKEKGIKGIVEKILP